MLCQVLVSGCFNVFHVGHCELLEFASQYGPVVVALNADDYMKRKYGQLAVPLPNRVKVLESCKYVDKVVSFFEDEPSRLIRQLQPQYYIRGPDYRGVDLIEQEALDDVRAQLIIHTANKIADAGQLSKALPPSAFDLWKF